MTRYRIGILASLVSLALLAGCSNSGSCKSACRKIAKCMGIKLDSGVTPAGDGDVRTGGDETSKGDSAGTSWTCPLSTECSEKESCYARCINKADCDAITGKDQQAAADLAKCSWPAISSSSTPRWPTAVRARTGT